MPHSLLITLEYPPQKGGVANYYHGIVANWTYGKLEVLHVKLGRLWPRWLSIFFEVRSTIYHLASRIDLLQVGQVLPLGYVAVLMKWLYGIPYLVYTHGMDVLVPQTWAHKKWLLKFILQQAKLVVANSEFTKGEVVKLGIVSEKVVVVYPGIAQSQDITNGQSPTNSIREISGASATSPFEKSKIILTVSRLVPRKGIDTVLAALPEVIKKVPSVQYVVIGTGPDRARLENLAMKITPPAPSYNKRGLGGVNPVLFLGAISDEEKIAWYKKASIFVLVPRPLGGDVEGFGMVYLEANSFGLPVVGSRTGGVPEAVVHGVNGLLVEPNNSHQTAEALITLLTQKSLADTLGVKGVERVNKEFTWDIQLQKLYPHLLS